MTTPELTPLVTDAPTRRGMIRTKTVQGLQDLFPIVGRDVSLEVRDIRVKPAEYSSNQQKDAILRGKSLFEPVVGTLVLKNKQGEVIDTKKDHIIAHLPYFTERHTFVVGGNEYDLPTQLRLKSGVYTRERGNGEYEASFNLRKGDNFRLAMEPESGKFHMELGTTRVPLYPLLRSLGIPDTDIRNYWGQELRDVNAGVKINEEAVLNKIINRVRRARDPMPVTLDAKRDFVRKYFTEHTSMDPDVTERTLGQRYDAASPIAMLTASKKLLQVHRGDVEEDDRDSLEFKHVVSADDFFRERLNVDAKRTLAKKLEYKLNQARDPKIRDVVPNSTFTKSLTGFLTTATLSSIPMQINPVEMVDHAWRVTSLGEGGITNDRAIPNESRKVHNTHLGILDAIRTPEAGKAGVDVRATVSAARDAAGNLYTVMINAKTGKREHVPVQTLARSTVGFFGQDGKPQVDALRGQHVVSVPRAQVDYFAVDATSLLSPTTAMVPLLNGMQGNRAIMGSKYQTQALPLLEREAPLVQAEAQPGLSMERAMMRNIVPTAQVSGTIEKIDGDYIYIRPSAVKKAAEVAHVYTYVPREHVDSILSQGLHSGKSLLAHPEALHNAATARGVTPEAFRKEIEENLGSWKAYASQGPNVVFAPISPAAPLGPKHPTKQRDLVPLRVDLAALKQDMPDTRLYGMELIPYGKHEGQKRHRYLSDEEVRGYIHGTEDLWQRYSDPDGKGFYAADVPHAAVHTPTGSIPGKYLAVHAEPTKKAADISKHTATGDWHGAEHTWAVPDLWEAAKGLPVEDIDVLHDVDTLQHLRAQPKAAPSKWYGRLPDTKHPDVVREMPRVHAADLSKPIIIHPDGSVLDGRHRIVKAYLNGDTHVKGVRLTEEALPTPIDMQKTAAADEGLVRVPYDHFFPLASKTYIHNDITVKPGDKVTAGQPLAESNFSKDGTLALGKNLSIAYMAYYGHNSNDAVVISEDAARKLTSEHMYKVILRKGPDVITDKKKYVAYYSQRFTAAQLAKLDDNGLAKPGSVFEPGDPVALALTKAAPSAEAQMLGNLHKSLVKPYRDSTEVWDHHVPGVVKDVVDSARQSAVTLITHEPMKIGDKLANRFGGKGVVSEIIPNDRMVRSANGKPLDVLFTSAGIVSRINPAQVVEAALGKVADKTGKPVIVPQFMKQDNVSFAKELLKKHNLSDKETVYDPVSDKSIPNVFVGKSYVHKLFKSTETNYSARGTGSYDVNLQPTKGGEEGAKGLGRMELNALIAHNARNVIKDAMTVKSEKSDDYWRALEFGLPPPPPKTPFVAQKFQAMVTGAGINMDKRGTNVALHALTDKHVENMSAGALQLPELEKSKSFMVTSKNMQPEKGGLFDPALTGGLSGTKWSHIQLPEPMLNPVFEEPARRLLGLTKQQLQDTLKQHGGAALRTQLNNIDIDTRIQELRAKTKTARAADLDGVVKQLKYLEALKSTNTKPGDAYVVSKVPVIPPIMRPILPSTRGGELQVADANYLYRDLGLAAVALKNANELGLPSLQADARQHMYEAHSALAGIGDPVSPQLQARGVKGFVAQITGQGSPKQGFLFKKVLKRQQDLSGRATATPDNTLDMDQVGLPEDMVWSLYGKFLMKGLIGQGYSAVDAKRMVEERHPAAKTVLDVETQNRPVFINRAPSLHRHNMIAAYPVPVAGKSMRVNSFMEQGQNLDYDGDAMQIHVPVSNKAVEEAKDLTLSKLLFSDKNATDLMVFPQHEAIIGTYLATVSKGSGAKKKFKTKADAVAAYRRGEIKLDTPVEITG